MESENEPITPITPENVPVHIIPTKKSKLPMILGIIILMGIVGTMGFLGERYLTVSKTPETIEPIASSTPIPTISDETIEIASEETLTIFDLTLTLPTSWWSEKHLKKSSREGFLYLDPIKITGQRADGTPKFELYANTYQDLAYYEIMFSRSTYKLEPNNPKKRTIVVSGKTITIFEGMSEPGMFPSYNLKIAIVSHNGITYKLQDNTSVFMEPKYEDLFEQIISTFKFSSSTDMGTITGQLCYPSSYIPPGKIAAKNILTGETLYQEYAGTEKGGKLAYSFELKPGKYNLRLEGKESNQYSGYYTLCAIRGTTADACSPTESHNPIPVEVVAGKTTENINLCDYYYPRELEPNF